MLFGVALERHTIVGEASDVLKRFEYTLAGETV
jgi:hypothetical protein